MNSDIEDARSGSRCCWMTPVELLVVILVVGILVGILIPAVQQVRTAAKRTQSQNNLRQITLGALNFESAHMRFPVYVNRIKGGSKNFGWAMAVIPQMEASNLYSQVKENESWDSVENSFVVSRAAYFYSSPFERKQYDTAGYGVLHYAACSELFLREKGAQFDDDFDSSQYIFGEICDGYEPWAKPGSCREFGNGIRFDTTSFGSPALNGALMARVSGSVEFVSSDFPRPTQTFEGNREQGANGRPDSFGYELGFAYSPIVKGWRGNCWYSPTSKGYGGGKALDDEGLKQITQDGNLVALILGGAHEVTGNGLSSLEESSLTRMSIDSRNLIQDEDLKALHNMTKLKHLGFTEGDFSDEAITDLRQALPNCEILVR